MIERLDYLASLGVNAVELLPIQVGAGGAHAAGERSSSRILEGRENRATAGEDHARGRRSTSQASARADSPFSLTAD